MHEFFFHSVVDNVEYCWTPVVMLMGFHFTYTETWSI